MRSEITGVLVAVGIIAGGIFGVMLLNRNDPNIITDGTNPHVVLIRGTGCIINDVPEVSNEQMLLNAQFCIANR